MASADRDASIAFMNETAKEFVDKADKLDQETRLKIIVGLIRTIDDKQNLKKIGNQLKNHKNYLRAIELGQPFRKNKKKEEIKIEVEERVSDEKKTFVKKLHDMSFTPGHVLK